MMDMRRSDVVEAIAGDAGPLGLSAKLANSIERSNTSHRGQWTGAHQDRRQTEAKALPRGGRPQWRGRCRSINISGDYDRPGEDSDQMLEGVQGKVLVTRR
jgi:hypothetical protein